jgi:hypothetical protein
LSACNCGSGNHSWWLHDAQGIPLSRVCVACQEERVSKFRPEILDEYNQSDVDESIEESL